MLLSIITINRNNAAGLRRTMESVLSQTRNDIEYIIIDGASSDGSVEVIQTLTGILEPNAATASASPSAASDGMVIRWLSEADTGIYNAMNKGIRLATGEYCQFLNSGDLLASNDVVERMLTELEKHNYPDVLYGDMQKVTPDGRKLRRIGGGNNSVTLNMFYRGCLNHSPAYIRKSLFDIYGMYDESLRICSDWKFYMQSLVLGKAQPIYVNILVTVFDTGGISETQLDLLNEERNQLLEEMVPQGILRDYERYHFPMSQYDRLKKYHLWGVVWFMERVLFKLEKWGILR